MEAPTPIPVVGILVVNSGSEAVFDLAFPPVLPTAKDEIEYSFNVGGVNSNFSTEIAPKPKDIRLDKCKGATLKKKVEVAPLVQDPVQDWLLDPTLPFKDPSLPSSQKLKQHKGKATLYWSLEEEEVGRNAGLG